MRIGGAQAAKESLILVDKGRRRVNAHSEL